MRELAIPLDSGQSVPLYEQIYQYIKKEIQERQILPEERLPSTRALARSLQVSRSTVEMAYDQLVSEGYIEARPQRGHFACEIEGLYRFEPKDPLMEEDPEKEECWKADFAATGMDVRGFPEREWRKISREVLNSGMDLFSLGNSQGEAGLRSVLAAYLHHARGVNCRPGQIIVGAGNDYLLMLLRIILGESHVVAMENPAYKSAWQSFSSLGYVVLGISMDSSGMKVEELEASGADIAYVMPSHQFPMGNVMPQKRRNRLLAWASRKEERYLIEDDYDSEFRYRGKPIPALQGYDAEGKVIYLGTFSRSVAPAIRISYMVLPEKLMQAYEVRGRTFSATVSRGDQKIVEAFLRDGGYERHLNRMRALYRSRHDLILSLLRGMQDICRVSGENAGVHVVLTFVNGLTEAEAVRRAASDGVRVYGISDYAIADMPLAETGSILLGYATLDEEQIRTGMAILAEVWRV